MALPLMVGGAVEVGGFRFPPPLALAAPPTLGNMQITSSANVTKPILSAFGHLRDFGVEVWKQGVMSGLLSGVPLRLRSRAFFGRGHACRHPPTEGYGHSPAQK